MPGGGRPAALAFIFVTVMLDMLALGLILPVLPRLVVEFRALRPGPCHRRGFAIYGLAATDVLVWFGVPVHAL